MKEEEVLHVLGDVDWGLGLEWEWLSFRARVDACNKLRPGA